MAAELIPRSSAWPRRTQVPTARELNALVALAEHGDGAKAAAAIGISHQTLRNLIGILCRKVGATSSLQAYHVLRLRDDA